MIIHCRENPRHQSPKPREAPIPKLQDYTRAKLKIGIWDFPGAWGLGFGASSRDYRFNLSVRLFRWGEDFVFVFATEPRKINRKIMFVRHRQLDARNFLANK